MEIIAKLFFYFFHFLIQFWRIANFLYRVMLSISLASFFLLWVWSMDLVTRSFQHFSQMLFHIFFNHKTDFASCICHDSCCWMTPQVFLFSLSSSNQLFKMMVTRMYEKQFLTGVSLTVDIIYPLNRRVNLEKKDVSCSNCLIHSEKICNCNFYRFIVRKTGSV